ncbi:MAG: FxsA family protein [Pseudomonadota bacterium]
MLFNPVVILGLFIAVPLIEIVILIQLGSVVGVFTTIGIVIATAVIGTTLLRQQGFGVLARATETMQSGEAPIEPVVEGVLLLIAGAFLLTPGLLTDAVGFTLLVPVARRGAARWLIQRVLNAGNVTFTTFGRGEDADGFGSNEDGFGGGPVPGEQDRPRQRSGRPPDVIDGEFERLDEKTHRPRGDNGKKH